MSRLDKILLSQAEVLERANGGRQHFRASYTLIELDAIYAKAQGACAICGTEPQRRFLHLDHDHKTGKARGLLCVNCNTALGHFKDDVARLKKAIEYLEDTKG